MQVLEAKEESVEAGRYEEAALLRDRELDLKAALVAPAEQAPRIALVDTPGIEQARTLSPAADTHCLNSAHGHEAAAVCPSQHTIVCGSCMRRMHVTGSDGRARLRGWGAFVCAAVRVGVGAVRGCPDEADCGKCRW